MCILELYRREKLNCVLGYFITHRSDIEIVKVAYPQLRDERQQLDYDYSYMENFQAITFPKYPILYKDKEGTGIALKEMECFTNFYNRSEITD